MKLFRLILVMVCLSLTWGVQAYAQTTDKLFKLSKGKALVILMISPPEDGKPYANVGDLTGGNYDPQTQGNKITPFSGWLTWRFVDDPVTRQRYYVGQVNAGDVALYDFSTGRIGICFNSQTVSFSVEAGKTYFIGRFDPKPYIREINSIIANSQLPLAMSQVPLHYVFDRELQHYNSPAEAPEDLSAVSGFIENIGQAPRDIIVPEIRTVSFLTGRDAFGTNKLCRGYYSGKADADK